MSTARIIAWLLADYFLVIAPAVATNLWLGIAMSIACGATIGLCMEDER